ncbi:ABC transporter permease [Clostridium beijerinckii]|uniref:ABC transporter permease n=1 Tax=Clostridium beijerinckii TaxID=1520 RepID=UPI0014946D2B|nr:ABC transporter permease [Clostridium beijerinckii]NOW07504.1 ABC-2 type transport system permease protein [Clostridium beijerinckii]NYC04723.1 ABC-2 type transport system permease protein [Clostridium beijerinckii]
MKYLFQIIKAEILKQHRNKFNSITSYFSLLVWPIILFFNTYYSYMPFNLSQSGWKEFDSRSSIFLFLIIGLLGYLCFWALVQSAWEMSNERQNGTLEIIFLTPVNRLALIYGRALGSLFESIWAFCIFSIIIVVYGSGIPTKNLIYVPITFVILIISATVWGGLMNVIFLFSRDASIIFNIFDEPMSLFSGVRIPSSSFPMWAKIISAFFPLTHALVIVRSLLIHGTLIYSLGELVALLLSLTILIIFTIILLKKAENNARKTSNFTFY